MAVDYTKAGGAKPVEAPAKPTVKDVLAQMPEHEVPSGSAVLGEANVNPPRPSEIDVFLSLLTAQTMYAGGNKYWANQKNIKSNVEILKRIAKQIVEAY